MRYCLVLSGVNRRSNKGVVGRPFQWVWAYSMEIDSFLLFYGLFGEKNDRIFRGDSSSLSELIATVTLAIAKWALIRKEFSDFALNDIMVNWETCMKCGPVKGRRVAQWSPPPLGVLKFNVDRATRGKPGLTGIGGVLCNNNGEVLFRFSKNGGVCDSNEA